MRLVLAGAVAAVAVLWAPSASACPGTDGSGQTAGGVGGGSCPHLAAGGSCASGCPHKDKTSGGSCASGCPHKAAGGEGGSCSASATHAASQAGGCGHAKSAQAADSGEIRTVSIEDLAGLRKDGKAIPVDANRQETRTRQGVIPGAILLSSAGSFDPAKELPASKDSLLVFYCANQKCRASHEAAKRAQSAGYANVAVLPAGIAGWKDAGQPTAPPQS